jgi:hypothetical protein
MAPDVSGVVVFYVVNDGAAMVIMIMMMCLSTRVD